MTRPIAAFAFYLALAVAMTWPLATQLESAVPDLGDPLLNAWIIWWNASAVPLTTSLAAFIARRTVVEDGALLPVEVANDDSGLSAGSDAGGTATEEDSAVH